MTGRWWRAYDEAVDDPKLILLTDRQFRAWFNLCCICSQNGGALPATKIVAVKLRTTLEKTAAIMAELATLGLLDVDREKPLVTMHNWNGRQYQSDVSTDRVKRFRKHQRNVSSAVSETVRNVSSAVSETVPDTETDTDTDTDTEKEKKEREATDALTAPVLSLAAKRGSRLPEDWQPSIEDVKKAGEIGLRLWEIDHEAAKFRDYWTARSDARAISRNWSSNWRNWCRKAIEMKPKGGARNGAGSGVMEALDIAISRARGEEIGGDPPMVDVTPRGPDAS